VGALGTIRFLLALAVTITHVGQIPFYAGINSLLAVQGFYVISGFLIARIWDIKYAEQPNGIRLFYINRAARIYLMYWVVLFVALAFSLLFHALRGYWPQYMTVDTSLSWQLILYQIISNVFLAGSSLALFLGATVNGSLYFTQDFASSPVQVWSLLTLAPAWTLELELWFYLLAPFILRLRLLWIIGLIGVSFTLRFIWYDMGHDVDPWTYRFFPFEIGVFLLGVIAYRVGKHIPATRSVSMATYIVAVAAIAIHLPEYLVSHRFLFLVIFAAILPMIFELTKDWRFDRFLADISFPLYLCHWPLAMIAWRWPAFWPGMPATVLAILYACALVIWVERPIDRWRHARFRGSSRINSSRA
jgi:peptidoglycan/LPS O-acetylase OafA/YrhL